MFKKKVWKRGDKLNAKELNRIEEGIADFNNENINNNENTNDLKAQQFYIISAELKQFGANFTITDFSCSSQNIIDIIAENPDIIFILKLSTNTEMGIAYQYHFIAAESRPEYELSFGSKITLYYNEEEISGSYSSS